MIQITDIGGVRVLTLNRPEARNALSRAGWAEFDEHLSDAAINAAVAAVVVAGTGPTFCAGADLKESRILRHASAAAHPFNACIETISAFHKPLIAVVAGAAVGGGMTMLLHFDFIFASQAARFNLPFGPLGVLPEGASSLLLQSVVGPRTAARMLLAGEWMEADEALSTGFVTRLLPGDEVHQHALDFAAKLATYPRAALLENKRLLVESRQTAVIAALSRERRAIFDLSNRTRE